MVEICKSWYSESDMRILVTGGAGFIGSNIVDQYIRSGHRVSVVDNLWHGFKRHLHPKAKFYKADIRNLTALRRIMQKDKPEVINHHAAIAEVIASVRNPLPTMAVNVQGTINLLLAGSEVGIKKIIFASTGGAIYGDAQHRPTTEQEPALPVSPYGLSKLLGEECVAYYSRLYGFNYVIFRYPNVYGPRQDPHGEAGVVAIFCEQLAKGRTVMIFGDGSKTRDYVYSADIVRANVLALRRGNRITINLGRGKEISDQMVFDTIHQHFPHAPQAAYQPVRSGEVIRSCLRANVATKKIGWKPRWTFSAGVTDYLVRMHYV
ncbi:MAG: UDP-glucose 4-epimerase [uncultured bacterium]|nr:MAG: UDP-glucose 4-epimerase [uncultured bacterium]